MLEQAESLGKGSAECRAFLRHLVEALASAAPRLAKLGADAGLILDPEVGQEALADAAAAGVTVGLPVERAGVTPLWLFRSYESVILARRPAFAKCVVRGRPDDHPELFHAQNATLARLHADCERARLSLLIAVVVPRRGREPLEQFEQSLRNPLAVAWIQELRAVGVRPSVLATHVPVDPAAAKVLRAAGEVRKLYHLGMDASASELAATPRAAADGLLAGSSVWWEAFLAHLGGASADQTVSTLRDAVLAIAERWGRS